GATFHVPLRLRAPGRGPGRRRPGLAPARAVAPPTLRLAALPVPPAMQGRDLFAAGAPEESGPLVAEALRGLQIAARQGPWKLVRTLHSFYYVDSFQQATGARELYRLDTDPDERENLIASQPEAA